MSQGSHRLNTRSMITVQMRQNDQINIRERTMQKTLDIPLRQAHI
jgi:hypothetical protein